MNDPEVEWPAPFKATFILRFNFKSGNNNNNKSNQVQIFSFFGAEKEGLIIIS